MNNRTIPLWDEKTYKSEDGFMPSIDTYILNGDKIRAAVLICPGGGYAYTSPREAEPIAIQFNAAGYNAFVLNYSVSPRRHPQPLMDLSKAMSIIRQNAGAWNIDPQKIALCGFSAGGHLAASLGVYWKRSYLKDACGINEGANKPNALILCYPVITSGEFAHRDSFAKLLGEKPDKGLLDEMSLEKHVNKDVPPVFIWHTFDDRSVPVENSLSFANELRKCGIPFELHIYPEGPHGLSLATNETDNGNMGVHPHVATWLKLCTQWVEEVFKS